MKFLGPDVLHAGIATHYCESSKIPELERTLLQTKSAKEVDTVINEFCPKIQLPFSLAKNLDRINECFDAPSPVEILNKLEKDGSEWAKKTTKVNFRLILFSTIYIIFFQLLLLICNRLYDQHHQLA